MVLISDSADIYVSGYIIRKKGKTKKAYFFK